MSSFKRENLSPAEQMVYDSAALRAISLETAMLDPRSNAMVRDSLLRELRQMANTLWNQIIRSRVPTSRPATLDHLVAHFREEAREELARTSPPEIKMMSLDDIIELVKQPPPAPPQPTISFGGEPDITATSFRTLVGMTLPNPIWVNNTPEEITSILYGTPFETVFLRDLSKKLTSAAPGTLMVLDDFSPLAMTPELAEALNELMGRTFYSENEDDPNAPVIVDPNSSDKTSQTSLDVLKTYAQTMQDYATIQAALDTSYRRGVNRLIIPYRGTMTPMIQNRVTSIGRVG